MQVMRDKPQKKGGFAIKVILVIAALAGVSLLAAMGWQSRQESARAAQQPDVPAVEVEVPDIEVPQPVVQPEPKPEPEPDPQPEPEEPVGADPQENTDLDAYKGRPEPAANAVPQSSKVDNSYFADAIFFGDSISTGIPLYQVAGNPDTVAFTGIDPVGINTNEVILTNEGLKTVLEAAKQYGDKKKVYIMLGANALWMEEDAFVWGYGTFVRSVKEQYPDAVVYIQSILPVTSDAYLVYATADNRQINRFNQLLQKLAQDTGVHYLDICQEMMDENGLLPKEASPRDGMHLTPEYYEIWFNYLKTHTVEGNGQ